VLAINSFNVTAGLTRRNCTPHTIFDALRAEPRQRRDAVVSFPTVETRGGRG
jgi:hypothetical protein